MPSSSAGAQQVNARSEWLDQQIDQVLSGNTAGDAPWGVNEQVRHRVILSTDGNDPEADRYSQIAELEYRSQRAVASGEMTVFDREDAEFGGRSLGSSYAMDDQRTLQHMKGYADTWAIVKGQIAERDAMLQAQDAQAATARSQREADNVTSWRELEAQTRSGGSTVASTGNAMFVSEGGAAFGNRQLSIRERTQTNDPDWSRNVLSGFRGEPLSVMATHDAREAAKLGGLLRFGFDLTPVGAGYNYVENTAEGRPFSAILSIAPYAIPGAVLVTSTERALVKSTDGIVTNKVIPSQIDTPWGAALQSSSPAALAARSTVEEGTTLYRLGTIGKSEAAEAQFWALQHPLSPGYASRYGIPPENVAKFNFIESATLKAGTPFVTRPAPGIGTNPGGGIEVVVPKSGVTLKYFSGQ